MLTRCKNRRAQRAQSHCPIVIVVGVGGHRHVGYGWDASYLWVSTVIHHHQYKCLHPRSTG